jgi:membrane protease YdiL (CAAX protease family)
MYSIKKSENMNKSTLLISECIILFLIIPLVLILDISIYVKLALPLLGLIYCTRIILKEKLISVNELYEIHSPKDWKPILIKTVLLIIISTLFMYLFNEEKLFLIVRKKPVLWISICLFYSIFSVLPQELLYRSFFFKRYASLFKNTTVLITINAIAFSLAHSIFQNIYISVLTLIGGFVFAMTYRKSKSLLLTSIEHAIYGSWLFTLGVGEYLAFPGAN